MTEIIRKLSFKKLILNFIGLTLGAMIYSAGLHLFLVPNNIIDGGVVGISLILSELTKISFSFWVVILNIPFFYLGYKRLGKSLAVFATVAVVILSFWTHWFETWQPITTDPFLATIFGGVIIGIGVGLVIRSGGSLDGTEIVAIWLDRKISFSVGEIVLFFNIFILGSAGFVFNWNSAMYSLVAYFICSKVIDIVTVGLDESKGVLVVTNYGDEVSDALNHMGRSVTILYGQGGYLKNEKKVLYLVVSRLEVTALKQVVHSIDEQALISVFDVSEVHGGFTKKRQFISNDDG